MFVLVAEAIGISVANRSAISSTGFDLKGTRTTVGLLTWHFAPWFVHHRVWPSRCCTFVSAAFWPSSRAAHPGWREDIEVMVLRHQVRPLRPDQT